MKNILFILVILFLNYPIFANSKLEKDPAFIEFKSKLNKGWQTVIKKNILKVERIEPIYVMPASRIQKELPQPEDEKEKLARLKKFGMKMKPNITYKIQKRWTINDAILADQIRDTIQNKISKLPKKYKIEHLLDNTLNTDDTEIYTPKTKADKRKLQKYFAEKTKLESKIPKSPDYHLVKFSLFLISKKGVISDYSEIFPESVMGEFIHVEKLLFKYKVIK